MSNPNITQARQAAVAAKPSLAHIPGTGYWPIFSEASYFKDSLAFVQTIYQRCGPVSRAWWGFKRSVYLLSAEANEMVLLDREGRFSAKLGWERYIGDLFPRGLLLHDAEDHRWQRRLMLPAFRKDALAHYLERMNPRIQSAITAWGQSGQIHFYPLIKQLTLAIAADVFLGAQLDAEIEQISRDYTRLVIASMAIVRIPVLGYTYARGVKARARLAQFIRERIPQRRASEGSDLFTQLCQVRDEQGAHFSDDEIIDHLIFMMTAAHDTTTSAITTMMYALAKHPEWQTRLRREAQNNPCQGAPNMGDLAELPELELALKEALRLYQPLASIVRTALVDFEIHGIKIPAGADVSLFPIFVHRSPQWWSNPDQFDPERFAPGRAEHKRHPFAWTPFGGGAHMCLGLHFAEMQVKAVLLPLLRKLEWSVPADYQARYSYIPIAKPRDDLPLQLRRLG